MFVIVVSYYSNFGSQLNFFYGQKLQQNVLEGSISAQRTMKVVMV